MFPLDLSNLCDIDRAMHEAAIEGNYELVEPLLSQGANINSTAGWDNHTLLHYAAEKDDIQLLQYLLSKNVDLDVQNVFGKTALMCALYDGRKNEYAFAKLLIKSGANLEIKDNMQRTPLLYAFCRSNFDIGLYLIDKGAKNNVKIDPQEKEQKRLESDLSNLCYVDRAMHEAAIEGNYKLVEYLLNQGANINSKAGWDGYTLLHYAVVKDDIQLMQYLLSKNADIDVQNIYGGETALMYAMGNRCKNQYVLAKFLIDNGANLEIRSTLGRTPLMYALSHSQYDSAMYLIEKGADIHVESARPDEHRTTLLLVSGSTYDPTSARGAVSAADMVKLLVERGVDIHAQNADGTTALMKAAMSYDRYVTGEKAKDVKILEFLLKHGADPKRRRHDLKTAADFVKDVGVKKLFDTYPAVIHRELNSREQIALTDPSLTRETKISNWKSLSIFDIGMQTYPPRVTLPERPVLN